MTARVTAILLGLALATLPFVQQGCGAGHTHADHGRAPAEEAHSDHAPRYGGVVLMEGDHHLEIVRRGSRVSLFVSDAYRRPLRPVAAHARFVGSGLPTPEQPMTWKSDHYTIALPGAFELLSFTVQLEDVRLERTVTGAFLLAAQP